VPCLILRLVQRKPSFLLGFISIASMLPGVSLAGKDDSLALIIGLSERYDSNLFRLSSTDEENTQRLLQKDKASDVLTIGSAELRFDQTYSLQHVQFQVKASRYQYQTFDYLGFTSLEYDAAWGWGITPRIKGMLSASRLEQPDNYSDYTNFSEKNVRSLEARRFALDGHLFGSWFLIGGVGQSSQKNSATFREEDDYQQNYAEAGLKYSLVSGNSISILGRSNKGEYTDRMVIPQLLLDDRFAQRETEARLAIAVFEKSKVVAAATHFRREHDRFSERDYSGTNWNATYRWDATARLYSSVSMGRRYDSFQDSFSSYALSKSGAFTLGYTTTEKSKLSLSLQQTKRDFSGGIMDAPAERDDVLRATQLGWAWEISRAFSLTPALSYQRRTSRQFENEYDALGVSVAVTCTL